jgi:D-lyxose ketol-isomerase
MKRSEINRLIRDATACFVAHGWALPPEPRWDVTDFGLGDWRRHGLVLVNLAEEPEYCEKLMYAQRGMTTPHHWHQKKKEDIICRWGELRVDFSANPGPVEIKVCGRPVVWDSARELVLHSGERVTLVHRVIHAFEPVSEECVIGEVSTANDDLHDNFFVDRAIGRFSTVDEDEPPAAKLVSDRS